MNIASKDADIPRKIAGLKLKKIRREKSNIFIVARHRVARLRFYCIWQKENVHVAAIY